MTSLKEALNPFFDSELDAKIDEYIKKFEEHMLHWRILHDDYNDTEMAITIDESVRYLRGKT